MLAAGGQRSLGAAEGVLVALRHCRLDGASWILRTRQHIMAPMRLADALMAIAQNDLTRGFDGMVVSAVDQAGAPCWPGQAMPLTVNAHDGRSRR